MLVLDDPTCRWVKLFRVSTVHAYRRMARLFRRQKEHDGGVHVAEADAHLLHDDNARDIDDESGRVDWAYANEQAKIAASFLGGASASAYTLYGIEATYAQVREVGLKVVNIQVGNMDFDELIEEPSESELARLS